MTEQDIREIKAKTYAYMTAVLLGPVLANTVFMPWIFFSELARFLKIGIREGFSVSASDIGVFFILGILCVPFALLAFLMMRYYAGRIRIIRKKGIPLGISISIMTGTGILWGWLTNPAIYILLLNVLSSIE